MKDERAELATALKAVTDHTPQITRGVINASKSMQPISWRKHQLGSAIRHARQLLDELTTKQVALGWRDEDAA